MPSLDSLPDNEEAKNLLPCYRLLDPGSSAEATAQRCKYRRDNLAQRTGILVETDTNTVTDTAIVDAFVHSDASNGVATSTPAPKAAKGQASAALPPALGADSNKGANDLRDQETGEAAPGGPVEQLER